MKNFLSTILFLSSLSVMAGDLGDALSSELVLSSSKQKTEMRIYNEVVGFYLDLTKTSDVVKAKRTKLAKWVKKEMMAEIVGIPLIFSHLKTGYSSKILKNVSTNLQCDKIESEEISYALFEGYEYKSFTEIAFGARINVSLTRCSPEDPTVEAADDRVFMRLDFIDYIDPEMKVKQL